MVYILQILRKIKNPNKLHFIISLLKMDKKRKRDDDVHIKLPSKKRKKSHKKKKRRRKQKVSYLEYILTQMIRNGSFQSKQEGKKPIIHEDDMPMFPDRDQLNTYPDRYPGYEEEKDEAEQNYAENILAGLVTQSVLDSLENLFIANLEQQRMKNNWVSLLKMLYKNMEDERNKKVLQQLPFRIEVERALQDYRNHLRQSYHLGTFDPAVEIELLDKIIIDISNATAIEFMGSMRVDDIIKLQKEFDSALRDIYREQAKFQNEAKELSDLFKGAKENLHGDIGIEFENYLKEISYRPQDSPAKQVINEFIAMKKQEGYSNVDINKLVGKMDEWLHNLEENTKTKELLHHYFEEKATSVSLLEDAVDIMQMIPENVYEILKPEMFTDEELKEIFNAPSEEAYKNMLASHDEAISKWENGADFHFVDEEYIEAVADAKKLAHQKLKKLDIIHGTFEKPKSGGSPWTKSKKVEQVNKELKKSIERATAKHEAKKNIFREEKVNQLKAQQKARKKYWRKKEKLRDQKMRAKPPKEMKPVSTSTFHIDDDYLDMINQWKEDNIAFDDAGNMYAERPPPQEDDYEIVDDDERPLLDEDEKPKPEGERYKIQDTQQYKDFIQQMKEDIKAKSPSYAMGQGLEDLEHMSYEELVQLHWEEMLYHNGKEGTGYVSSFLKHFQEVAFGDNPELALQLGQLASGLADLGAMGAEMLEGLFSIDNIAFVLVQEGLEYTNYHNTIPIYYYDEISKTYKWSFELNGFHSPLEKMIHYMGYYEFMKFYAKHKYLYTALAVLTADPILGTAALTYWGTNFQENKDEQAIQQEMAEKGEAATSMYYDRMPQIGVNQTDPNDPLAQTQTIEGQIMPPGEWDYLSGTSQFGPQQVTATGTYYLYWNVTGKPEHYQYSVDANGGLLNYGVLNPTTTEGAQNWATINPANPNEVTISNYGGYGSGFSGSSYNTDKVHYVGAPNTSSIVLDPNMPEDNELLHDLFGVDYTYNDRTSEYMLFTTYDEKAQELYTWGVTYFHTNPNHNIHPQVMKGIMSGEIEAKFIKKEHHIPPKPEPPSSLEQSLQIVGARSNKKTKRARKTTKDKKKLARV